MHFRPMFRNDFIKISWFGGGSAAQVRTLFWAHKSSEQLIPYKTEQYLLIPQKSFSLPHSRNAEE